MKVAERVMDVTSTLGGEKVAMTIHDDALAHIMSVLTDLYSDPELAVIREYSTNALDAQIQAGVTRPIEVTTPSPLAPYFRVRDYGVGLDADGIREIYSRYGASTKRDSNDVVGMLGLGCKSALTYTDQFTLSGIKDGRATEVCVSRDEDGAGSMTIVSEYDTDEPNGVEVVVPVRRDNKFGEKAASFFRFWKSGTVLIDGNAPAELGGYEITKNIRIMPHGAGFSGDYVVMGNVPYPAQINKTHRLGGGYEFNYQTWGVVAFVEIGEVQFTPSREQLQMTKLTKATLDRLSSEFEKTLVPAFNKHVSEAPTRWEAIEHAKNFTGLTRMKLSTFSYKGVTIPENFTLAKGQHLLTIAAKKLHGYRGYDRYQSCSISKANAVWFTGFKLDKLSPTRRAKLDKFLLDNQIAVKDSRDRYNNDAIVALDKLPLESEWINPANIYKWEDVEAVKLPAATRNAATKLAGSYNVYQYDGKLAKLSDLEASDIDQTNPIYYTVTSKWHANLLQKETKGAYSLVYLNNHRLAKFLRNFPSAIDMDTLFTGRYKKWCKGLTDVENAILAGYSPLDGLHKVASRIEDPEIRELLEYRNSPKYQKLLDAEREAQAYREVGYYNNNFKNKFLESYPLLTNVRMYDMVNTMIDHLVIYINAAYAARKENS